MFGKNILEKHLKYKDSYKKNALYWGLGIENEFYFQFNDEISFSKEKFINNHSPERYSVNYFAIYKEDIFNDLLAKFDINKLPLLLNSHSFSKTDQFNQPRSLYKSSEINPNYNGKTLWEFIQSKNLYLKESFNKNLVFDGDSIEIMTVNFYNATLDSVIKELTLSKNLLQQNIQNVFEENNIFHEYGKIGIMNKNHPFAVMLTNKDNMCMFNNGTLHFNVTLPTQLDDSGKIENWFKFMIDHKNYIKLIQFMEPLFLCVYGEPDPLSKLDNRFSACSQRCAISRYIGIGTYDTDLMKTGKQLVGDVKDFVVSGESIGWYKKYYDFCGYKRLDQIGYDINFNKHYNHGVEIRFFENQANPEKIKEIGKSLIYLADFALDNFIQNPILLENWHNLVVDCMKYGKNTKVHPGMYNIVFKQKFTSDNVVDLYFEIINYLENYYNKNGKFSKYSLSETQQDVKCTLYEINDIFEKNIARKMEDHKKDITQELEQIKIEMKNQIIGIKELVENTKKTIDDTKNLINNHIENNNKFLIENQNFLKNFNAQIINAKVSSLVSNAVSKINTGNQLVNQVTNQASKTILSANLQGVTLPVNSTQSVIRRQAISVNPEESMALCKKCKCTIM